MATFTTTINETLRVYGPQLPNQWGNFNWGENWGAGTDLSVVIFQSLSDAVIDNEVSVTDSIIKKVTRTLDETLNIISGVRDLGLTDANGYAYVFSLPTDNAANRSDTDWTNITDPSTSWSEDGEPSTTWSAA